MEIVLPVGIAVVGSFAGSSGLFDARKRRKSLVRLGAAGLLAFGVVASSAYLNRLPDDARELIALLGSNDMARQGRAAARLQETTGASAFVRALEHPDARVRESAARGMWRYARKDVEPALREAGRDGNPRVRAAALGSLFHMGIEEPLLEALTDSDPYVRRALCRRISYCGDASHIPALEALLEDEDSGVRKEAQRVIDHLGP